VCAVWWRCCSVEQVVASATDLSSCAHGGAVAGSSCVRKLPSSSHPRRWCKHVVARDRQGVAGWIAAHASRGLVCREGVVTGCTACWAMTRSPALTSGHFRETCPFAWGDRGRLAKSDVLALVGVALCTAKSMLPSEATGQHIDLMWSDLGVFSAFHKTCRSLCCPLCPAGGGPLMLAAPSSSEPVQKKSFSEGSGTEAAGCRCWIQQRT